MMKKFLKPDEIPKHIEIMSDGRPKCWEYGYLLLSNRCGMCPACYGMIMNFEMEPTSAPPKKKSFRLWG